MVYPGPHFYNIDADPQHRSITEQEKELEILVLRHLLAILQRKCDKPVKPNRIEKMTLAVLAARLKQITHKTTSQLSDILRIFQPETEMGWHRELVRRKWTYIHHGHGGRPRIDKQLEDLILRFAQENPRWGYGKIERELLKLDYKASQTTIRNVLHRHTILPADVRSGSIGWRHLMNHYKNQILACDFFALETIRLQTLYVFFFIELGSRQVHSPASLTTPTISGSPGKPDSSFGNWMAEKPPCVS